MQIYIIVKGAHQVDGELNFFTCEEAFKSEEDARAHFKGLPTVWREEVQGFLCDCERAVHIVELN